MYTAIRRLKKEYPKVWEQLKAIWDPDDFLVRKFEISFENQNSISTGYPDNIPSFANRFGENDDNNKNNPISPTAASSTSTTTKTTPTVTPSTTTRGTTKPTNKPPIYINKPTRVPPLQTVGPNLQATVSFGTNLVGGIVKGLGNLGTRVVETGTRLVQTGTKLATVVFSAVVRPPQ